MKRIGQSIESILRRIDGRGYKAYKDLEGARETVDETIIRILHVQGDPFAPPSTLEVKATLPTLPGECISSLTAVEDLLLRILVKEVKKYSRKRGEGKSGLIEAPLPAPIMVPRAAVHVYRDSMREVFKTRLLLWIGLPSRRRRILAREAQEMLLEDIPSAIQDSLKKLAQTERLPLWCRTLKNQDFIRRWMINNKIISFIADGSILPRKCGGCWEPLEDAVPFESPPSLRVTVPLPAGESITGMALKKGLTLIVGPAFHGKTTLLESIASGVWNHIPGDGREYVLTRSDAIPVKSENGRSISCVDLEAWLVSLPRKRDASRDCFTTSDASGATSVASSIQEAVEAGSKLILMDEDMVASNILHRDVWVEQETGKRSLRTIPDLAHDMKRKDISMVIVASGALPLLAAADTIIVMDEYKARDATSYREEARKKASKAGLLRDEKYSLPKPRRVALARPPGKWKLRGYQLEARNIKGHTALDILGLYMEEYRQVETSIAIAFRLLERDDVLMNRAAVLAEEMLEEVVRKGRNPGATWVRGLDVTLVVNRLPTLKAWRGIV